LLSFALVVVPTVLMGATLPLLVEHMVQATRNVGFAVGGLYFVNTLGSAAACFVAGDVLMRLCGQSGSFGFAVVLDTLIGIASVVGSYLLGVALGSRLVELYSRRGSNRDRAAALRLLGWVMLASAIASFVIGPSSAYLLKFGSAYTLGAETLPAYLLLLPLICVGALFFGATFPLVSYVSVQADQHAGAALSYLYTANIVGSTLGSFAVGFVLMDHFSLWQISSALLVLGVLFATAVLAVSDTARSKLKFAVEIGRASCSDGV